ncbi:MAG: transposase [Flavobacteriaceae bacterium]|nr:MAG: transposase [Flavobacteriaceae bacterium]
MINIPSARRYYLYSNATDMRKSFNGLSGLVNNEMGKDIRSGDGFIFINKRRTLIKILIWDRSGFVIYYKKLSSGTIQVPDGEESEVSVAVLMMMLEGVDLKRSYMRKRYGQQRA